MSDRGFSMHDTDNYRPEGQQYDQTLKINATMYKFRNMSSFMTEVYLFN